MFSPPIPYDSKTFASFTSLFLSAGFSVTLPLGLPPSFFFYFIEFFPNQTFGIISGSLFFSIVKPSITDVTSSNDAILRFSTVFSFFLS
jgi:hypothetical protein